MPSGEDFIVVVVVSYHTIHYTVHHYHLVMTLDKLIPSCHHYAEYSSY